MIVCNRCGKQAVDLEIYLNFVAKGETGPPLCRELSKTRIDYCRPCTDRFCEEVQNLMKQREPKCG